MKKISKFYLFICVNTICGSKLELQIFNMFNFSRTWEIPSLYFSNGGLINVSLMSLPNYLGGGTRYMGAAAPTDSIKRPPSTHVALDKLYGPDTVLLNNLGSTSSSSFTANMVQQAHAAEVSEALQDLFDDLEKVGRKGKNRQKANEESKLKEMQMQRVVSFIV